MAGGPGFLGVSDTPTIPGIRSYYADDFIGNTVDSK